MALLFADGFDFWSTMPGWWDSAVSSGGVTLSITGGVISFPASGTNTNAYLQWDLASNTQTLVFNMRIAFSGNTSFEDTPFLLLMDSSSHQCSFGTNSEGKFWVKRGSGSGTQVGSLSTASVRMDGATFYDVEVKVSVANSGSAEIRLNGESILSVSGDLASTANEYANRVRLGRESKATGLQVDHITIADNSGSAMNDFVGPLSLDPITLTADGNYTAWTVNTGDRWDAINDADPDGDTTYITDGTVGNKYSGVAEDVSATTDTVHSFSVVAQARHENSTARGYKVLLRSGTTDELGAEKTTEGSYSHQFTTFDVSPFTTSAWTAAEINGLELGVETST